MDAPIAEAKALASPEAEADADASADAFADAEAEAIANWFTSVMKVVGPTILPLIAEQMPEMVKWIKEKVG
uniref:Venom peptide ECTX1-Rm51a n=1 Tax=Rhytidoponera metallica TaxID=148364 RepID=A0A8U0LU38_RHYMT|nr:venom peptide precursor ECTX1-Rm51a [Rhytidoponera metallica]